MTDFTSPESFKDSLDKFQDMWDAALQNGFEDEAPALPNVHTNSLESDKPAVSDSVSNFTDTKPGLLNEEKTKLRLKRDTSKSMSWSEMYDVAFNLEKFFTEEEHTSKKDCDVSAKKDMYALRPNPIETSSKGKDQELRVTPNFSDGDKLRELGKVKMEMESLERKVHSAFIEEKEGNSLAKELENLRGRFEKLSNALTPNQEEDVT